MSPITVNVLLALQITDAAEYLALNLGAVEVAPVDVIVVPLAPCNVTCPVPICCTLTMSLAANTDAGIVTVTAEELFKVTMSSLSPITSV